MRDKGKGIALLGAFSLLFMASITAAGSDLRLIEAVQNQDLQQVSDRKSVV